MIALKGRVVGFIVECVIVFIGEMVKALNGSIVVGVAVVGDSGTRITVWMGEETSGSGRLH